jgi:hypothetical protein
MSSEAAMVAAFSPLRLELFAACNQHAHRYEYDGAVRRVSVESQKQRSGGGMEEATVPPSVADPERIVLSAYSLTMQDSDR